MASASPAPEKVYPGLPPGTKVKYTVKALPGQEFVGEITQNGPADKKGNLSDGSNQKEASGPAATYRVKHNDGKFDLARGSCTVVDPATALTATPVVKKGGYYEKYLKYKRKYLELKALLGGQA